MTKYLAGITDFGFRISSVKPCHSKTGENGVYFLKRKQHLQLWYFSRLHCKLQRSFFSLQTFPWHGCRCSIDDEIPVCLRDLGD